MPGVAELVRQSLEAAKGDASKEATKSTTPSPQTPAGGQDGQASQLPAFMSWMSQEEWSALPEGVRQKLISGATSLHDNAQKKTTEAAAFRKKVEPYLSMVEELDQDEQLRGRMEQAYHAAKAGIPQTTGEAKSQTKVLFDSWMETADPASKETLRQLREAILQETDSATLKKELSEVKGMLRGFLSTQLVNRTQQLTQDFSGLSEAFTPLVEQHHDELLKLGAQYPTLSAKKLLQLVVSDEEYEGAVKADGLKDVKKELKAAKEGSTTRPQTATGSHVVGIKKEQPPQLRKVFGAQWDLRKMIPGMVAEAKQNLP